MTAPIPEGLRPTTAARFSSGDRAAFDEVYAAYAAVVRGWVRRFFSTPFETEDAVQEVWLHVTRNAAAYEVNRGPLRPWLRALTANRCREVLRSARRTRDIPLDDADDAGWLDAAETPEHVASRAELREALSGFAATLPPDEYAVFAQGWLEGRSIEEMAQGLQRTARQVKYLRLKVLLKATADRTLRAFKGEVG